MKKILLITLGLSALLHAGFTTVGQANGVVKDTNTQLQWQDYYNDLGGSIILVNWASAIDYCETLALDGGGWRLPNKKELLSLVDYAKYNPSIDAVFNHTTSYSYWSSTTVADRTSTAWIVYFSYGRTNNDYKSNSYLVRCVR